MRSVAQRCAGLSDGEGSAKKLNSFAEKCSGVSCGSPSHAELVRSVLFW